MTTLRQSALPSLLRLPTSRQSLLVPRLSSFLKYSITVPSVPAICLSLPRLFPYIFESILRAVPKKKQSHSRRRMRQMAGKALMDVVALGRCSGCGREKRSHVLCPFCVKDIRDMWQKKGLHAVEEHQHQHQ